MSAVSEVTNPSAVPPLLKAVGKDTSETSSRERTEWAGSGGKSALQEPAVRVAPSMQRLLDQQEGTRDPSSQKPDIGFQSDITPGSGRYSMFVDAVQALRLDRAAAEGLPKGRVAELKAAAKEIFNVRNGIPRDQRPSEVLEEQRQRDVETEVRTDPVRKDVADPAKTDGARELAASAASADPVNGGPSLGGAGDVGPSADIPEPAVAAAAPEVSNAGGSTPTPDTAVGNEPSASASDASSSVAETSGKSSGATPSAPVT